MKMDAVFHFKLSRDDAFEIAKKLLRRTAATRKTPIVVELSPYNFYNGRMIASDDLKPTGALDEDPDFSLFPFKLAFNNLRSAHAFARQLRSIADRTLKVGEDALHIFFGPRFNEKMARKAVQEQEEAQDYECLWLYS
jgi:hypothetical protein